ncbi:MAG TPA: serine hydrolase domain-containing protein [Polyangiaceae bacterium]
MTTLENIADLVVRRGAARAAAVAVAARNSGEFRVVTGVAGTMPVSGLPLPSEPAPIFDLASVTKPFVAVTAARLARLGNIDLGAPLARFLPELAETPSAEESLLTLLAHRAGLEAHRPLFAPLVAGRPVETAAIVREAASARRTDCAGRAPAAGFPPLYSDLGYLLVGVALERAAGRPLDELVEREVARPLGLDARSARLWLGERCGFPERVLPTETVAFRGGEIRGVTHDENAWAFAGHGLAGHAGLFGTAEAVARFGAAVLDAAAGRLDAFLTSEELGPFIAERAGGSLRAGFDGKSGPLPAAGNLASAATFGHLGFTGTSLWCDPKAARATVLLTNRVCPTRENLAIRAIRPEVHDLLFSYAFD